MRESRAKGKYLGKQQQWVVWRWCWNGASLFEEAIGWLSRTEIFCRPSRRNKNILRQLTLILFFTRDRNKIKLLVVKVFYDAFLLFIKNVSFCCVCYLVSLVLSFYFFEPSCFLFICWFFWSFDFSKNSYNQIAYS